jgi:dephospho-CoA kinase
MKMDVGLIGLAGSGKDTAAIGLVANGWLREAFADHLKHLALEFGWNGIKDAKGRALLQDLGMAGRKYNPDCWVEHIAYKLKLQLKYRELWPRVWTDVRFQNEADFIRKRGGIIIRINRPEIIAENHESELKQLDVVADYTVDNTGTIPELRDKILDIIKQHNT